MSAVIVPLATRRLPEVAQLLLERPDARTALRVDVFEAIYCTGTRPPWPGVQRWEVRKREALAALFAGEDHDEHVKAIWRNIWFEHDKARDLIRDIRDSHR